MIRRKKLAFRKSRATQEENLQAHGEASWASEPTVQSEEHVRAEEHVGAEENVRDKGSMRAEEAGRTNEAVPNDETEPIGGTNSDPESLEDDDCPVIVEEESELEAELGEETNPDNITGEFLEVPILDGFDEEFGNEAQVDNQEGDDDSGDDIWDDHRIPDPLSDSDDENWDGNRPREEQILHLGKLFNNSDDFKEALLRYSLKTQYDIVMYKSSSQRLGAKCSKAEDEKCQWRCYCSFEKAKNKLMVKVYVDEHICVRSGYTKLLKSSTIGQLYEERLRLNPKFTPNEMLEGIKREFNMIVTIYQCRRAKTLVLQKRKASHETHFARIWDYQGEILRSNQGSTVEIETIPGPNPGSLQRFYRLYVCFQALKSSWKSSCRPIIGLDAAFMKWDIKGQLLGAVGRDGDNRIFPIAWAVVDAENLPNWLWFVQLLKKDLELGDGAGITFISDKHQGILSSIKDELPRAEHRMCAKHVVDRWKKTNKDFQLERIFWRIARSYTIASFEDGLEELKKYNAGAFESLQRTAPASWSRAFFKIGSFCNDNLNNLSESFNRTIREARRLPLLDFLTEVRRQTMERNARRTILTRRWKKRFTPKADKEIEINRKKSTECKRFMTTGNLHEIDFQGDAYCVDMTAKTCGCGYWQMNGIPCMHAMCVITSTKADLNLYVSDYYLTSKWRQLYAEGMKPVQGMKMWKRTGRLPVLPPPLRPNKGRPNDHARRKAPHESSSNPRKFTRHGRVGSCSNCKQEGHNKTRCPNPPADPQIRRPRGRPRKITTSSQQSSQPTPSSSQQGSQGQWSSWPSWPS